jgi:hypothetical protein
MKKALPIVLLLISAVFLIIKLYKREKTKAMNDTLNSAFAHVNAIQSADTVFTKVYDFPKGIMIMNDHHKKEGLYDSNHSKVIIPMKYDEIDCFGGEDVVSFLQDKKYGFLDTLGNEIIPAMYDFVSAFEEGLAPVKLNGKWGYINKKNKNVIPIKYELAWPFYADRAAVKLNDKWGFIDHSGKYVITPIYDDVVFYFNEKYKKAKVGIKGKYIFIDKNGRFSGDTDGDFFNSGPAL